MFIKIDEVNYFVETEGKTLHDVYTEIFGRMNVTFMSKENKRKIMSEIRKQVKFSA